MREIRLREVTIREALALATTHGKRHTTEYNPEKTFGNTLATGFGANATSTRIELPRRFQRLFSSVGSLLFFTVTCGGGYIKSPSPLEGATGGATNFFV
jgi:hypothetical protein